MQQQFASDNYSEICPEAWRELEAANHGHSPAYGEDLWTRTACDLIREIFETDCEAFFVGTGTAANALSLATLCRSFQSIICHRVAHIETDECGAPEFFSNGSKLQVCEGAAGKVTPEDLDHFVHYRNDLHYPKPACFSVTQSSELGTVYDATELETLGSAAKRFGLRWHMDGARFANALVSLDLSPRELSWEKGVDVLCLGGTKNGLGLGEAVVFFDHVLAEEFTYRCKQAGHLISKMRYLAAPWCGYLRNGVWLRNARHANAAARHLAERMSKEFGLTPLYPVQANAAFFALPTPSAAAMREKGWRFYTFIGSGTRLMCSWNTTEEAIDHWIRDLQSVWNQG